MTTDTESCRGSLRRALVIALVASTDSAPAGAGMNWDIMRTRVAKGMKDQTWSQLWDKSGAKW